VLVYSGSLDEPRKGLPLLLAATALLRREHPALRLRLFGPGDPAAALAAAPAAARAAVECARLARPGELAEAYGSWATVLPATAESFGMVVVESLASGTRPSCAPTPAGRWAPWSPAPAWSPRARLPVLPPGAPRRSSWPRVPARRPPAASAQPTSTGTRPSSRGSSRCTPVPEPLPSVTVCVVVRDRLAAMTRCLEGVLALQPPAPGAEVEVVVIDNGSTDGTREMLHARARQEPRLRVVEVPGLLGVARNAAVAAARGEVVAFTDSDCVPERGWLVAGLAPFADRAVGVVQGRTAPAEPTSGSWDVTQDIGGRTGLFEACNVLYRRELLQRVGGFGEEIGFFGEDTVAGRRVLRTGAREVFARDAVVRHDVTRPGFGWHLRRTRGYAHWPELVRQFPELRRELLWGRVFLRRRSAEAQAALAGVLLAGARRSPVPLLAAAPLLGRHRPRTPDRGGLLDAARAVAFDLAVAGALVRGSVTARTVVL
jgi:GT2 family glycosyltransferase